MKNSFEIDYTDNPDVAAMLSGKDIGAKVEVRLVAQLNKRDDQRAELTIEEIEVAESGEMSETEDGEDEAEPGGPVEATAEEPVAAMLSMRRKRKEQPDVEA
jgi:hypothetical protein